MARSYRGTFLIIIMLILFVVFIVILSTGQYDFKATFEPETALSKVLPRYRLIELDEIDVKADYNRNGNNDAKDIVLGAKKQLEIKAKNIFIEGSGQPNYYKDGDPPSEWALNTDIIARAFKEAGYDLRLLINEDIQANFEQYPLQKLWNQRVADIDIDYRRIQNMEKFFQRKAISLITDFNSSDLRNLEKWFPGDVVFFDMNKDGYTDNAGIITDSTTRNGTPKIIYNYIEPGYTVEENILESEIITGHYRYSE
ncbi:MAG: DUF1287 domain-containing protein [Actinomycetota bacterium]|nr:DUF1287 domain-containing protein [Actinomycetota bacterium]